MARLLRGGVLVAFDFARVRCVLGFRRRSSGLDCVQCITEKLDLLRRFVALQLRSVRSIADCLTIGSSLSLCRMGAVHPPTALGDEPEEDQHRDKPADELEGEPARHWTSPD
jgi:hypothetical protein